MAEQHFDVFLCHNSEDKPAVIEIAQQLQSNNLKPWLDVWELQPGAIWQYALEQQIETIAAASVFVGDRGLGPWHSEEIYAFLQEFVRRKCPVIPVILHDARERPQLPIFLRNRHWVDFRLSEPNPLVQLIWGITGQAPDRSTEIVRVVQCQHVNKPKFETEPIMLHYKQLARLLAVGNWEEADKETLCIMLRTAKRTEEGFLDEESIRTFPHQELRAIDRLWVHYSQRKFGFSSQKEFYESYAKLLKLSFPGHHHAAHLGEDNFKLFSDRVGWIERDNVLVIISTLSLKDISPGL